MTPKTFDYRLQTLNCPSCGAPVVTSREGGSVRCAYCASSCVVTARAPAPRAGLRSSLAEEAARLSRLKAQLEHPVVGHFYDLTRPPSGFEQWVPGGAANVERLLGEWSRAIQEPLGERAEVQRRVCWMALRVASVPIPSAPDPMRTRVLLETTLGWLIDEGYRHFIRCRLAQAALEAGDLDAAEGWMTECDWAPEVLELDSALRMTRSWLACRRCRADDVLELLGGEGAPLPIAAYQQDEAARLRVDAFETLKQTDAATRGFQLLAAKNGLVAESERFALSNLAPQTVRAALCRGLAEMTRKRIVSLRTKIAELARRREQFTAKSATKPLRWLPVHAMALALAVLLVRCSYNVDPLGGSYGYVLCPKVCSECRGPTRTVTEWVDTGPGERGTNGPQYFC
ncbi:MAG TPA: hypothetical protein VKP30_11905, partial [Polyangiaceae bacterium]|nr:hypothetical protein [Polyangiaceae bacterium]